MVLNLSILSVLNFAKITQNIEYNKQKANKSALKKLSRALLSEAIKQILYKNTIIKKFFAKIEANFKKLFCLYINTLKYIKLIIR